LSTSIVPTFANKQYRKNHKGLERNKLNKKHHNLMSPTMLLKEATVIIGASQE